MSVEKKEVGLQFLNNDAGEHEGLGDAGIETYRDSPYASSARECGQNSGDAGTAYPVILSFDLLEVPAADFPALEDYKAAVKICLEQASDKDDEKEFDFFVQAETALETEKIKILRISDENTTGLIGPAVDGTPYHALVKATGASQKSSKTSGGSFGIGKNAVYAISNFQTVFYSTVYLDEELGKERFLAQGKTKLTSHKGKDGIAKRATGYWGIKEGFQPVSDKNIVPDWLKRDKVGTSVFSIGFNEFPGWQYRMACSLIQNFFCAIHRGEMVFSVNDGEIQINQNSLQTLFKDEKVIQAAEDTNHLANFNFSRDLYECLISPESIETLKDVDGLGQVAIRVLIREDLPKRVCIIRNGMVITDSLENFGDKFSRFPMYRDFVALIESREDTGSTLIKKLENPRHDGLSAQRILDSKKQEAANATVKSLAVLIRETIKEQTILQHGDEVSIDEMSEFFADDDSSERRPDPDGEGDPETIIYEPPKKKRRKSPPVGKGKSGGAGGSGGEKGGKGGGKGPGAGGGKGGDGTMGESHLVELDSVRNTLIADGGSKKRVIYFTPLESGETSITVMASGLNDTEPLEIIKATGANVSFGKLVVDLIASDRTSVEVEFSEPYTGPLELLAISEAKTEEETKSENN